MRLALPIRRRENKVRRSRLITATPFVVAFCVLLPESTLERLIVAAAGGMLLAYLSNRPGPVAMCLVGGFIVLEITLPLLYRFGVPGPVLRSMGFWKESLVVALAVSAFRNGRRLGHKPDVLDWLAVGTVLWAMCYWLFPGSFATVAIPLSSSARQVAFRSLAFPLIALVAVRHADIPDVWRRRCLGAAVFVGIVMAIGSVLEMSFPQWWNHFLSYSIGQIPYRSKVLGTTRQSMLSYADFANQKLQRSGSWYGDPLTIGFTYQLPLAAALTLALIKPTLKALAALVFIAIGLFLVQGRAALLAGVVTLLVTYLRKREWPSPVSRTTLGLILAAGTIIAVPFFLSSAIGHRSTGALNGQDTLSAPDHIKRTQQAIERIIKVPMGTGLGSAGGNANRFGVVDAGISENHFLAVGIEVGVIGMVLYVALIATLISRGLKTDSDVIAFAGTNALVAVAVGGFLLHSLESPVTSIPALVAAGLAVMPRASVRRSTPVDRTGYIQPVG